MIRTRFTATLRMMLGLVFIACSRPVELPPLPSAVPERLPFDGTYVSMNQAQRKAADAVVDRLAAECMRQRGFDYVEDPEGVVPQPALPGWGISTEFGREAGRPADLSVESAANTSKELTAEAEAYEEALHGTSSSRITLQSPEGGEVSYPGPDSCFGQANQAAFGDMGRLLLAQEEVLTLYKSIDDHIDSDARLRAAERRWAECMADKGFTLSSPNDGVEDVSDALATLVKKELVPQRGKLPVDPHSGTYTASSIVGPELAALQLYESELFAQTESCDTAVGLNEMRRRVRYAYETILARERPDLIQALTIPF